MKRLRKISFVPAVTVDLKKPIPTRTKDTIPAWYINAEKTFTANIDGLEVTGKGLKACLPFLDAMVAGYVLVTPQDIEVRRNEEGIIELLWDDTQSPGLVSLRKGGSGSTIPRPEWAEDYHLTFPSQWGWSTPKGYSTIVTHPFNRFDLPFITMSAIVDSDKIMTFGNIPFFLKKNFEGVIPAGTPFAQIIPFKRDSWFHNISLLKRKEQARQSKLIDDHDSYYRRFLRVVKEWK